MGYTANIEGFEGQNIEVNVGFWSRAKLLVNGVPAQKGRKRGEMVLQRNDGRQVTAAWKPQFLGLDVPQLTLDGKTISFVKPLKWYQWAWGGWPVVLIFIGGGVLGAIAGITGFKINAKVFRSGMSPIMKYAVSAAVSVLAVVAYFVAAIVFSLLINR
jgi:hypothetical protein